MTKFEAVILGISRHSDAEKSHNHCICKSQSHTKDLNIPSPCDIGSDIHATSQSSFKAPSFITDDKGKFLCKSTSQNRVSPDYSTTDVEPESTDHEAYYEPPVKKFSRKISLPKLKQDGMQSASAKLTHSQVKSDVPSNTSAPEITNSTKANLSKASKRPVTAGCVAKSDANIIAGRIKGTTRTSSKIDKAKKANRSSFNITSALINSKRHGPGVTLTSAEHAKAVSSPNFTSRDRTENLAPSSQKSNKSSPNLASSKLTQAQTADMNDSKNTKSSPNLESTTVGDSELNTYTDMKAASKQTSMSLSDQCKSNPATASIAAHPAAADSSTCYSLALKPPGKSKSATEFHSASACQCNHTVMTADSNFPASGQHSGISTTFPSICTRTKDSSNLGTSQQNIIRSEDFNSFNNNYSSVQMATSGPPSCFISTAAHSKMASAGTNLSEVPTLVPNMYKGVKSPVDFLEHNFNGHLKLAGIYQYCSSSSSSSDLTAKQSEEEQITREVQTDLESPNGSELSDSSFSRCLLSGLTAKDSGFPPKPFNQIVDKIKSMKDMVDMWGGGEKGFHMALTLQKLHAARLKGMKEMEWQRELQLMDKDAEFSTRNKVLNSLKAEILETRRKISLVSGYAKKSQLLMSEAEATREIADLKLKIQKLQKKNSATIRDLNRHPIACGDIVRKTIARITEEYKERKRNISETCGPHNILQCN